MKKEGAYMYRCEQCRKPVGPWDIESGGCRHCGGRKVRPTNLTLLEKLTEAWRAWRWQRASA